MRRRVIIAEDDERQRLLSGDMQAREIGDPNGSHAAGGDDAIDRPGAEAGHAQQILAAGGADIEREAAAD